MKKLLTITAAFAFIAAVLLVAGCDNAVKPQEEVPAASKDMAFVIQLPGAARVLYYTEEDARSYKVDLKKSDTVVSTKTGNPGDKVRLEVTEEGSYTIAVSAYKDTVLIAEGQKDASVSFGDGDVNVTVTLTPKVKGSEVGVNIEWETPVEEIVIEKINAIGTVACTAESKAKIDEARAAYDALTETQKALIPAETLAVLTNAESTYESLITYTITIASGITNGTVTASASSATAGTEITLTVTPSSGYEISSLTVTDAGNNTVTVTNNKFPMPKSNVTVTAEFIVKVAETKQKPDAVGDIVLSDGTAVALENAENMSSAQIQAAVAIIFYAGNEETWLGAKTLGVGLNTAKKMWCTSTALAYSGYSTDLSDGKANTDGIVAYSDFSAENYPAFYFASTYRTAGYSSGWYLPSRNELMALGYAKTSVLSAATALGKNFSYGSYWSSCSRIYVSLLNHTPFAHDNDYTFDVCAIRSFD